MKPQLTTPARNVDKRQPINQVRLENILNRKGRRLRKLGGDLNRSIPPWPSTWKPPVSSDLVFQARIAALSWREQAAIKPFPLLTVRAGRSNPSCYRNGGTQRTDQIQVKPMKPTANLCKQRVRR
jgi:hypothetical protein